MRYCLDARSATYHFPGIGRYVSNLAREMATLLKTDERLILLVDRNQGFTWRLPAESARVKLVETSVSLFGLSQQWQIPRLLQHYKVNVYHSPYYMMPYFRRPPTIVTIHDLIPQLLPHYFSVKTRFLSNVFKKLAIKRASTIIVDSENTRRDIRKIYSFPTADITTIPLAADRQFQPQSKAEIERVRRAYQLPERYILYLGSNKPHKNLMRLVEAYAQVADSGINLPPLVIAGAWDNRYQEAKKTVKTLDLEKSVRFLGPISDANLPALYSGAIFFVFPSIYEGFGLPVIEAMACGTSVICANSSSLVEIGADAVLYFDPFDVINVAQQIRQLLLDDLKRTELCKRGLARVTDYSWQKTAEHTLHKYRQLTSME